MRFDGWRRFAAKMNKIWFFVHQVLEARLLSGRKMKILFSGQESWYPFIKRGFRFSRHEVEFGELSPEKVKNCDLVVPLSIPAVKYLNEVRDLVRDNPLPIPSMESVLLCNDKYRLNQTLMANGFGSLIPKMGKPLMYPYIVKTSIDEGGKTCQVIANSQQEDAVSEAFVPPEYFAQEFIAGPLEYALHAIFKDQDIRCSMNVEYAFGTGTPIKGREKITYTKICHCPYLDLFSSIVLSIGFQGLCCINYKVLDGRPFLIEINPRFGSSLRSYFLSFVRHLE